MTDSLYDSAKAELGFWKQVSQFSVCMVSSIDDGEIRARPMQPYVDRAMGMIRFLTPRNTPKLHEMHQDRTVGLTFANELAMTYVSVSGRSTIREDQQLIESLWGPQAALWFEGTAETADLVAIEISPLKAQYWTKTGCLPSQIIELGKGLISDHVPKVIESKKVDLS